MREAAFNAMVDWADGVDSAPDEALADIAFADLYAGSGAMALEAASRGAGPVLAVESDRTTARGLGQNAQELELAVRVETSRAGAFLARRPVSELDIVWFDPPYDVSAEQVDAEVAALASGWLAETALVIIERDNRSPAPVWPDGFSRTWHRRYGGTTLHFGHWDATRRST